jgi:hypothetical protein
MPAKDGASVGVALQPGFIAVKKRRFDRRDGIDSLARGIEEVQKPAQLIDMRAHLGGCADDARRRQTVAQRRAEGAGKLWP